MTLLDQGPQPAEKGGKGAVVLGRGAYSSSTEMGGKGRCRPKEGDFASPLRYKVRQRRKGGWHWKPLEMELERRKVGVCGVAHGRLCTSTGEESTPFGQRGGLMGERSTMSPMRQLDSNHRSNPTLGGGYIT